MLNIILLIVITICVVITAVIFARKFPQVSNLDVNEMPEEKISRKKKEIISKRIAEHGRVVKDKWKKYARPLARVWEKLQTRFRIYVGKMEALIRHEEALKEKTLRGAMDVDEKKEKLKQLINEGEKCLSANSFEKAEENFIAAVKLDPKAVSAYRGLGDSYFGKNSLDEAYQTYIFVSKLDQDDDTVIMKLAEISEMKGETEKAIEFYQRAIMINDSLSPRYYHLAELLLKINQQETAKEAIIQAVELEPQNPKFLDFLIEIAIICRDKELALKGYRDLHLVNPENQKLESFKDRINKI
ncbi:MAG: tetratricopeptide repeat protein [Patescibacteria group bacterium]|nr:tetratricopeptide repeat protein [Patescibacteria group bacterium]